MVSKCVNQNCEQRREFSGIGVVYALESGPDVCPRRPTEFFWLCPACMKKRLVVFHPREFPSRAASSNPERAAFRNLRRNTRRAYLPDAA